MVQALKNYYHFLQALLALEQSKNPAKDMTIIGVTGTDGKTTTASLLYHILKETGHKTALISTVAAYVGDKKFDTGFHVSTPSSSQLQNYIIEAKKAGMTHLVLEVTSHALDQHRVYGIPFTVGVLTNVSREHLDYHKTMENYMNAKAKLLQRAITVVLNRDDDSYAYMQKKIGNKQVITYGLTDADITPKNHPFTQPLPGVFNTYNTLAALAASKALNIPLPESIAVLSTFKSPKGRFDVVYEKDFTVIIDFAHTPNSIRNILSAVHELRSKGKIIHVFGSAGERDRGKRPLMGEASATFADVSIITSEDPRSESPTQIAQDIKKSMDPSKEILVEPDRQRAISKALQIARKGDTVVITGKGHEESMNYGNGEKPWSDYIAVDTAVKEVLHA